jgi:hypothetical protein
MADHSACDGPNPCFGCKMAYWRANGAPAAHFQGGREFWRNKTIRAEQERIVARGAARGAELVPYHSVWGN